MPVSRTVSRTLSKDSDSLSLRSSRTGSLRSEGSSVRSQSSAAKLRQKLITNSLLRHEENSKSSHSSPVMSNRASKHPRDTKATETPGKTLKQLSLAKTNSVDSSKKTLSRSSTNSQECDELDIDFGSPRKGGKGFKRSLSNSSNKSTPSRLNSKRLNTDKRFKSYNRGEDLHDTEISQTDSISNNQDDDTEEFSDKKITDLAQVPKTFSLTSSLGKASSISIDTAYSVFTIEDESDNDNVNDEFRFKRSKRPHYNLQESILALISKYKTDLELLDEKIKVLESQFFSNPPETTGIIKGWEGNVLNNAYSNLTGPKSRRSHNSKFKNNLNHTQNLITEHIFSLTSSTCADEESAKNNKFNKGESFINKLRSKNDKYPISYLEFREAEYKMAKERKEVLKSIGASIRDKCRAEIDEYVNCCSENRFINFKCKKESNEMHKCIRHYQKDATTPEAIRKVMKERFEEGKSSAVPSYLKSGRVQNSEPNN
ncbi:uncharacterized protein TA18550 [Theileria annulata]|uniref:Cytochrome c oxidase biogenesis protein Cmc1 like, putative n=1 Tax=Theileria annulata TaxID=5874 RepID=Q4UBH8_THEAN|nr:uncharacterized protein TA18550 [Theileria annulata]CAI75823.1 hypothetical protein TA18550 [Theileria annulata]|eukprot:XP_955299.1 hypothetical protein TA18550 [Theileria annulata]